MNKATETPGVPSIVTMGSYKPAVPAEVVQEISVGRPVALTSPQSEPLMVTEFTTPFSKIPDTR